MTRALSVTPFLLLLGASALVLRPTIQDPAHEEEEHTELEEHMESVEGAVKALRRSLRDEANRGESLALLTELQAETIVCKSLIPRMAETVPESERAAFVDDFRRTMVDFLHHQLDLERALLDGDTEAVKEAFGRVRDMEDSGHERFTQDEE